jgi:hypothetical protein
MPHGTVLQGFMARISFATVGSGIRLKMSQGAWLNNPQDKTFFNQLKEIENTVFLISGHLFGTNSDTLWMYHPQNPKIFHPPAKPSTTMPLTIRLGLERQPCGNVYSLEVQMKSFQPLHRNSKPPTLAALQTEPDIIKNLPSLLFISLRSIN